MSSRDRRKRAFRHTLALPKSLMRTWRNAWWQRPAPGSRFTTWVGRNWARVTYARHIEPTWLELTHHEVVVPDLPPTFAELRIVQLSDLHAGRHVPDSYLTEAVGLANEQRPDVVALTGDFVHAGYRHVDRIARIVGALTARHGVFAVLGNHDYSVRNALGWRRFPQLPETIASALIDQGIRVLRNEAVTLRRGEDAFHLVGVDDLWSRVCDVPRAFAGLHPATPRVLLAHNPRTVSHLQGNRCDLVLSGHTHGGQINWPGLGRILLTRKNRRLAAGMYRYCDVPLYVNRGVGFGVRFRFNVRPEVAVFRLRSARSA